jgi:MazG family protein
MAEQSDDQRLSIADLLGVMAALRHPETGCPWDLEQTFQTIAPYTVEEAYEVADAIERRDLEGLKGELGDLLFQAVYHARMAEEEGRFDFADVVDGITRKMIRRHPHVFADTRLRESFGRSAWEDMKRKEKGARTSETSVLADVPLALPALTRAVKLQSKAARVGFDWPSLEPVLAKAEEEFAELKAELEEASASRGSSRRVAEEFGDLLFVMANVARHLGIDPEAALREANSKFVRRFESIEAALRSDGRTPAQSSLEEMDGLWDAAKGAEEKL